MTAAARDLGDPHVHWLPTRVARRRPVSATNERECKHRNATPHNGRVAESDTPSDGGDHQRARRFDRAERDRRVRMEERGQTSGTPCPGGLGCADEHSCKSACVAGLDCAAVGDTRSPGGAACVPDGASVLATSRGITPVNWSPPKVRSPEEIAGGPKSIGYPEDDGGIDLPGVEIGPVQVAFDPTQKNLSSRLRSEERNRRMR